MKYTVDRRHTTLEAEPVVKEAIEIFKKYLKDNEVGADYLMDFYENTFTFEKIFTEEVSASCEHYYESNPYLTFVMFTVKLFGRRNWNTLTEVEFTLRLVEDPYHYSDGTMHYEVDKYSDSPYMYVKNYVAVDS